MTDNGNLILDWKFDYRKVHCVFGLSTSTIYMILTVQDRNWLQLSSQLSSIPGMVNKCEYYYIELPVVTSFKTHEVCIFQSSP